MNNNGGRTSIPVVAPHKSHRTLRVAGSTTAFRVGSPHVGQIRNTARGTSPEKHVKCPLTSLAHASQSIGTSVSSGRRLDPSPPSHSPRSSRLLGVEVINPDAHLSAAAKV